MRGDSSIILPNSNPIHKHKTNTTHTHKHTHTGREEPNSTTKQFVTNQHGYNIFPFHWLKGKNVDSNCGNTPTQTHTVACTKRAIYSTILVRTYCCCRWYWYCCCESEGDYPNPNDGTVCFAQPLWTGRKWRDSVFTQRLESTKLIPQLHIGLLCSATVLLVLCCTLHGCVVVFVVFSSSYQNIKARKKNDAT